MATQAVKARDRIPVAVVNGSGYGGVELLRLLSRHPRFVVCEVTARSEAGKPIADVFPHLAALGDLHFSERVREAELVFVALPDDASAEVVPELLGEGRRVLDLSAAFRLRDPAAYPEWYGYAHPAPDLLARAVYGLPERYRAAIAEAQLVACPGCYPTASILAVLPALVAGLIEPSVIVDAKSGVSGAGRKLRLGSHFSEVNEDVSAYGVGHHRHQPEIAQELSAAAATPTRVTFTPHLIPMTRGILATAYATLRPGVRADEVSEAYRAAYADEPFVHLTAQPPHTKWTTGANTCFVAPFPDERMGQLIAISSIDNLVKGAAGQAIQCANLMAGLEETAGLPREGVYP